MVKNRVIVPLEAALHGNHCGSISRVNLKLTNACNLRCKMCGQWGESGWHLNEPSSFLRDVVPLETYEKLFDDVAPHKPWISIWGGEPFLYRDLMPLIGYAKRKGMPVTVCTNGLTLEKEAERIVDADVDVLNVSIDGPREIHDSVRGLDGAFDRTTAGIRAIQAVKQRRGRVKPYIVLLAAANKENAAVFDSICEVAESVAADGFVGYYGWFQTEESCRHYEEMMPVKFGTFPRSQRGWLWSFSEIDCSALVESVRRTKARRWSFPCVFVPELELDEIPRYYREHANTFGHDKCMMPWTSAEIMPNGDVVTCADYPDYVVGNIRLQSLMEIWNDTKIQKFRNHLKTEGLLPICSRCCGLIGKGT
jgi:radical SAM protein with 4Fe4S-binding SPASM domain